jgi:hypothetical protein
MHTGLSTGRVQGRSTAIKPGEDVALVTLQYGRETEYYPPDQDRTRCARIRVEARREDSLAGKLGNKLR